MFDMLLGGLIGCIATAFAGAAFSERVRSAAMDGLGRFKRLFYKSEG